MLNNMSKLGSITIDDDDSGSIKTFPLPRNLLYRSLTLRFSGTITVGTADATAAPDDAVQRYLRNIEVVGAGKEVIKSFSGRMAYLLGQIDYKTPPQRSAAAVSTGAQTFEVDIPINFATVGTRNPADTYLDSRRFPSLDLRITCGDEQTDILTKDTTTTLTLSSTQIEIFARQASQGTGAFGFAKEHTRQRTISADNTAEQVLLSVGNPYKRIAIMTTDAGVRQSDIVNNIKLKSGVAVFADVTDEFLQGQNKLDYQQATMPDGFYVLDLCTDGLKSESLRTKNMSQLELELNVSVGTGTTIVEVVPMEVIMPRRKAA